MRISDEVGRKFNRGLDLVFAERFLDRPGTGAAGLAPMAFALPVLAGCARWSRRTSSLAAMLARGLGLLFALIMNSLVGLLLLCGVALAGDGGASLTDAARRLQPWFLASGLLGTFFVFASLRSYRALGVSPGNPALITAAQMVLGLLFDATGAYVIQPKALGLGAWVGAALLICGVALIVSRRT